MNSVVGLTPQTTMTLLPDTEAQRQKLRRSGWCLLFCGVVGFVGAFATYWLGFILAVLYFVAAGISIRHTSSPREVLSNACCFSPGNAFMNLRSFFILNAICTAVGIVFATAGIVFHAQESETVDVVFAVFALIACLVGLPVSVYASKQCRRIHAAVDLVHNKSHIVAAAAGAATAVVHVPNNGQIVMGTAVATNNTDNYNHNGANPFGTNNNVGAAPYGQEEMQSAPQQSQQQQQPAVYGDYSPQPHALGYNYSPSPAAPSSAAAAPTPAGGSAQPGKQASHEV